MLKQLALSTLVSIVALAMISCDDHRNLSTVETSRCVSIPLEELAANLELYDGQLICTVGNLWMDQRSMRIGPIGEDKISEAIVIDPGLSYVQAQDLNLSDGTTIQLQGVLRLRTECFNDLVSDDPVLFCLSGPLAVFEDGELIPDN